MSTSSARQPQSAALRIYISDMMRLSIVIISAASLMLWYQQFRTWVFALSLAIWHIIIQGFRYFFHAFKPAAEELPIAISGSTFTPMHETIAMDPDICESLRPFSLRVISSLLIFSQFSHVVYILPRAHRVWRNSPHLRCDHVDHISPSILPSAIAVFTLTQCSRTE